LSVDGTVRQRQTVSAFTEVQYCKLNCEQLQPTVRYTRLMSPLDERVCRCAHLRICWPLHCSCSARYDSQTRSGVKRSQDADQSSAGYAVACRLDLYRKDFLCFLPNQAEDANCQCLAAANARLPSKPHIPRTVCCRPSFDPQSSGLSSGPLCLDWDLHDMADRLR
jgi:hypothetical protein